jgi:subtilisin family serine protease
VMNISGGGFGAIVSDAIVDCIDAGMVVCVSAGNDRTNLDVAPRFPGQSDPDVVLVAGSAMSDTPYHLGFRNRTNYGTAVSVVAPAQHIRVANRTSSSSYNRSSGTSYAAPLTAGVLACMVQGTGRLTGRAQVQAVKARLLTVATAGRFRPQPQFGIGTLPDRVLYLDPNRSPPEPFGFTA